MINISINSALAILCSAASFTAAFLAISLLQDRRVVRDSALITIIVVACLDLAFGAVVYAGFRPYLSFLLSTPPHLYLLLVPMVYVYWSRLSVSAVRASKTWLHCMPFVMFHLLRFVEAITKISLPWLSIHEATEYAALGVTVGYSMHLVYVVRTGIVAGDVAEFFGRPILLKACLYTIFGCYVGRVLTNVLIGTLPVVTLVRFLFIFTSISIMVMTAAYWHRRILGIRKAQPPAIECSSPVTKEKYGNNRLPEFVSRSIVNGLEQHMLNDKPWLKVDLTLAQLAQGVNVNSHHLSQTINLHFGKSFACYINEYRVNEACKLLLDSKSKAILDVALESGFASKSSFNTLFKKQTGLTPSEYRKKYFSRNRAAA